MYSTLHIIERLDYTAYSHILKDYHCAIVICNSTISTPEEKEYLDELKSKDIKVYTGVSGDKLNKGLQLIRAN